MKNNPRIIAGLYKNQKLSVPKSARPLTDRVKRSIFDTLGYRIEDARVLDPFAGSGSFGIEALSRGAKSVDFIEINKEATTLLKENLENLKVETSKYKIINQNYKRYLKNNLNNKYQVIFLDPPFDIAVQTDLELISQVLDKEGILIFRMEKQDELFDHAGLEVVHEEVIGVSRVYYMVMSIE